MKIKRLELIGFKSFKDRTVINFDTGITGIVGPNGCGKSNIVDALVWVMGEQSSKHLRGSSMEDVIFNGSENFAPLGMAEVSLTLENDGGPFPAKWSKHTEIMVTRRLHRNGESEYFLNKEICRLKDIHDIFMDTGAGSRGFSIVEQGQIGKIITAKPEDRRSLIEEAAGITKFKVRKRESQRKLEGTEQNLVRLNDIIGELRRQLDSLQRQAKRAERYKELKNQVQDLDLWISSRRYSELKNEVIRVQQSLEERRFQEQEGHTLYSQQMAELQDLKLQLLEIERKVTSEQGAHFEIQGQVQKKESTIQLLQMEIESAKRSEELTGTLKSEISARRDILRRDVDHTESQLKAASEELIGLNQDAAQKTEASALHILQVREIDEKLTQTRRDLMSVVQGLTSVEVKMASLKGQESEIQQRHRDSDAALTELKTKESEFESHRNKAFSALESQRQMQLSIMKDVENFRENLNTLTQESESKRTQVESLKDDFNQVVSRLYGLETLNANFEGLKDGVKQVMTWQRERLQPLADGGFELVADVVEVPKDYELAMEAALGERLQSLLSTNHEGSLTAVNLLKDKQAGRSTFISPDLMGAKDVTSSEELKGTEGVRGLLKDLVTCPQAHRKSVAHILDGIVVVDNLNTALKLRGRFRGFDFVTLEGDTLGADGTLTGGSVEAADSGLLRQKREIKELTLRREEASGKLALATASLEKVNAQVERVSIDLEAAEKQSFEQEISMHDKKMDLERAESELVNVQEACRRQTREVEGLAKQIAIIQEQVATAEASIAELVIKKQEMESSGQLMEANLEQLKNDTGNLSQQATEAQVKAAAKTQAVEGLKTQLERLQENLSEADIQLARHAEDSTKNSEALSTFVRNLEEAKSDFKQLVTLANDANDKLKIVRDDFEKMSAMVRELEERASSQQQKNNKETLDIADIQLKLSQAEINEKYLADHIMERYMLNIEEVLPQYVSREGDVIAAQAELDDFKDKLKKIGEVNLTAIQEYEELTTRYDFLTKQQQDLVGAMDSLRKVIDRINRICNRRFRDTYEAVNERFKKVFPVLFGGGDAQLILIENPEASGEPGVEIMARPPGKKLQSVTLLSGGEKALTAVSLIFAIFLVKPSPFCLLDEVDAPLDDANVYRFNDLVREMSKRSQVILVTHNKHTMQINNTLYGVTMEDPGVSKMVAVRLNS